MQEKLGATMWNIEKVVSKGDYNYALVKNHPHSTKNGYVLEHRIVMENYLGRLLTINEIVHHIDGNKKNNIATNLEVTTKEKHPKLHQIGRSKKLVELICPYCKKVFIRRPGQTHLIKGGIFTACSNFCRGKISSDIQHHGKTHSMQLAISENILRIFIRFYDNSEQTIDYGMRRDYTPTT